MAKELVWERNSACFAMQNRHYCKTKAILSFSVDIFFTKEE